MNRGLGYYSSHVEPDLNDEPHIYKDQFSQDRATIEGYTAQLVGGGTNLYGGVSFRFTPLDFKLKSFNAGRQLPADPQGDVEREARDWPIQYEDLEPYYCKTEKLVGLNGTAQNQLKPFSEDCYQKPLAPNPISRYAKTGMEILARQINQANPALPYRTPLAVITEDHAPSGRTVPTNPQTEKPATSIATAIRWGASRVPGCRCSARCKTCHFTLYPNCVVTHLESDNGVVTKVHYLDPAGKPRIAEGTLVVVACSAIESVRLLKLSAQLNADFNRRINQNDLLGKYFLTHAFGGASAIMPERTDKSLALDADWATDCCNTEAFLRDRGLWAGASIYNNTSDSALPLSLFRTMAPSTSTTCGRACNRTRR